MSIRVFIVSVLEDVKVVFLGNKSGVNSLVFEMFCLIYFINVIKYNVKNYSSSLSLKFWES